MMELKEAIKKVIEKANKRWGANKEIEYTLDLDEQIIEKETLWYIPFTEKNVAKRSWMGAQKGYIIDKETGELSQPGSARGLETWIWAFELGFRDNPDLTIKNVNDKDKTVELLKDFGVRYVKPEFKNGAIWAEPKDYTKEMIEARLSIIPCTFKNQKLGPRFHILEEMIESKAFEFEAKTTDYTNRNIYGELIDENNLIQQ